MVIVNQRLKYLPDALKSATRQTISRDHYEIVLAAGSPLDVLELRQGRDYDRLIQIDSEQKAGLLVHALPQCETDIVSFLDDDDMFAPQKLERVLEIFGQNPTASFSHNAHIACGPNSRAPALDVSSRSSSERLFVPPYDTKLIRELLHVDSDYNLSSISIRKTCFLDSLKELGTLEGSDDTFFFYKAVESRKPIVSDSAYLTWYRHHPDSATHYSGTWEPFYRRMSTKAATDVRSHEQLCSRILNPDLREIANYRLSHYRLRLLEFGGSSQGSDRAELQADALKWSMMAGNHPPRTVGVIQAMIGAWFPGLIARMVYVFATMSSAKYARTTS